MKRTSKRRSASAGTPYLKPNETMWTFSAALVAVPPNDALRNARSSCALNLEVSMIRSATSRSGSKIARSSWIAFSSDPPASCIGCGRRVSLKRRFRVSPVHSKNKRVTGAPLALRDSSVSGKAGEELPLARVHDDRPARNRLAAPLEQLVELRDQVDGKVVHAEEVHVLEAARRQGLPRPRKPGDDDKALHHRPSPSPGSLSSIATVSSSAGCMRSPSFRASSRAG